MVDMPAGPEGQPEITFGSWQTGDETPGDLRIDVECLDAVLTDLSDRWPANMAPQHEPAVEDQA